MKRLFLSVCMCASVSQLSLHSVNKVSHLVVAEAEVEVEEETGNRQGILLLLPPFTGVSMQ